MKQWEKQTLLWFSGEKEEKEGALGWVWRGTYADTSSIHPQRQPPGLWVKGHTGTLCWGQESRNDCHHSVVVCDENSYNDQLPLTAWIKQTPLLINRQNELNTYVDSRYILFSVGFVLMFRKKTSLREWSFIIRVANSEFYFFFNN